MTLIAADGALKLSFPGASHTTPFIFFAPHKQTICATPAYIPGPFVLAVIFRSFFLSMCFRPTNARWSETGPQKTDATAASCYRWRHNIPRFVSDFEVELGRGASDLFTPRGSLGVYSLFIGRSFFTLFLRVYTYTSIYTYV